LKVFEVFDFELKSFDLIQKDFSYRLFRFRPNSPWQLDYFLL
jgi:hypothetical protein